VSNRVSNQLDFDFSHATKAQLGTTLELKWSYSSQYWSYAMNRIGAKTSYRATVNMSQTRFGLAQ